LRAPAAATAFFEDCIRNGDAISAAEAFEDPQLTDAARTAMWTREPPGPQGSSVDAN
jgi:hypothetical protein